MSFEDTYAGVIRVEIGHGYWIDVKSCLTHHDSDAAAKHLRRVKGVVDEKGKMQAVVNPDVGANNDELVLAAIVDWNLDEKDGSIWALSPDSAKRRNIDRLPDAVFKKLLKVVEDSNEDDPAERRDFRSRAVSGVEDGETGTARAPEVSDGEEAMGEPGDTGDAVA